MIVWSKVWCRTCSLNNPTFLETPDFVAKKTPSPLPLYICWCRFHIQCWKQNWIHSFFAKIEKIGTYTFSWSCSFKSMILKSRKSRKVRRFTISNPGTSTIEQMTSLCNSNKPNQVWKLPENLKKSKIKIIIQNMATVHVLCYPSYY